MMLAGSVHLKGTGKKTLWSGPEKKYPAGSEQHPPGPSACSQVPEQGIVTLCTLWGFSKEWLICTLTKQGTDPVPAQLSPWQ